MSRQSSATTADRVGAALNVIGLLIVIGACFLPVLYAINQNNDPVIITTLARDVTGAMLFSVAFLYATIFFEGVVLVGWLRALIQRQGFQAGRALAAAFTIIGAFLTLCLLLGNRLLPVITIYALGAGVWLMLGGYALALGGLALMADLSSVARRTALTAICLVATLAGGTLTGLSLAAPPQTLSCSHASQSDGQTIFGVTANRMEALRQSDGAKLWSCSYLGKALTPLVAAQGVLYAVGGTHVYALRESDGGIIWQTTLNECASDERFGPNGALVGADTLIVSMTCYYQPTGIISERSEGYSKLIAFQRSDGAIRWKQPTFGNGQFAISHGLALISDGGNANVGNALTVSERDISALRMSDGSPAWVVKNDVAVAVTNDVVIAAQFGMTGARVFPETFAGIRITDGAVVWQTSIDQYYQTANYTLDHGPRVYQSGNPDVVYLSGVAADGTVTVTAVRVSDGAQLWTAPTGTIAIVAMTSTADSVYFTGTQSRDGSKPLLFQALRVTDGAQLWSAPIDTIPLFAGDTVITLQASQLVGLGPDGQIRWRAPLPPNFTFSNTITVGDMIFANQANSSGPLGMLAINAADGQIRWSAPGVQAALVESVISP